MTEPEGETNAAWADLDAPDVKVIYGQFLSTGRGIPEKEEPPAGGGNGGFLELCVDISCN